MSANQAFVVMETSQFEDYGTDSLELENGLSVTQEQVRTVLVDVMDNVMVAGSQGSQGQFCQVTKKKFLEILTGLTR